MKYFSHSYNLSIKKMIYVSLLFAAQLFLTVEASACDCIAGTLDSRWRQADVVFTGKVLTITKYGKYERHHLDDSPVIVAFDVSSFLKGKVEDPTKFDLYTSIKKNTCTGFPFEVGQEYLVYGYLRTAGAREYWSLYNYKSGTYGVGGFCGGTQPKENVEGELLKIKENKKVRAKRNKEKDTSIIPDIIKDFSF